MKKRLLVFCFALLTVAAFAQTLVPAGPVSGTWDAANSPYEVNGDIEVQAADALTIDAGVQVIFQGYFSFTVIGQLDIAGTAAENVTITATDTNTGWKGLRFLNSVAVSTIDYANIEYGKASGTSPDSRGGGLYASGTDDLTITNSTFSNCSATGSGGAIYLDGSDLTMQYTTIDNNSAAGGAGMTIANSSPTIENSIISNNIATYDGGGLYIANSDVEISFTEITDNSTEWNGGGIGTFNGSNVTLLHATISGNTGNLSGSGIANRYNSHFTIINSIIYGNAYNNIENQNSCTITATYSNLQFAANQSYFGEGCIDANPLFDANYQLTWADIPTPNETKSPCIDAGNPAYTDPDGTIADMGAYYFVQNGIRGTVVLDGGTGVVTDVLITAVDTTDPAIVFETSPDTEGNYLLNVPTGTYNVLAVLSGYSGSGHDNVTVDAEVVVLPLITLNPPAAGAISGQVTISGVGDETSVTITAGSVSTNPFAVEDEFGNETYHYYLEITPGTYDVIASLNGYETQTEAGVVVQASEEVENIDFNLVPVQYFGTVQGTVSLVNGAGDVTNVVISCGTVTTNPAADGTYSLENVQTANNRTVTASLTGYASVHQQNVPVNANLITPDIDFELLDWQVASGTVFATTFYATSTYDGAFIDGSDANTQMGIFDSAGNCRGIASWVEGSHPQWSTDYYFYGLEGYWYLTIVSNDNTGTEDLYFRVYDSENSTLHNCNQIFFFPTDPSNDFSGNLTITSPAHTQEYDLIEEWNWISTNLNPANKAVTDIFDVLEPLSVTASDLVLLSQGVSTTYDPITLNDWIGDFSNISVDTGYKLHMPQAYNTFSISGEKINPVINPITLENGYNQETGNKGYNWISYYPYEELDLETALQSLAIPDSSIIKSQTQSAVYYGGWIGDLTTLQPGKAYLFKWHAAIEIDEIVNLVYPLESETRLLADDYVAEANWQVAAGNENNMIVMAEIAGTQDISVGLFDAEGNCHSIGKPIADFWYFTVTESTDELYFQKYDNLTRATELSNNSILFQADAVLGNPRSPIKVDFREQADISKLTAVLEQNSPNPFNPTTTIRFQLSAAAHTTLEIYNSKGQRVKTLLSAELAGGAHSAVWNGKDAANKEVGSGVYFYRLQTKDFDQTNKMLLIK